MKLASLKNGRDGRLVVVSRDLARMLPADAIAPTLQAALDDWANLEAPLRALYQRLEQGAADALPFDPALCAAPLPRAYQWADGSAYVNHVELVRRARGAALPTSFWTDPLIYQGGSDVLLGPHDPILAASEDWGIDFEAEIAAITDDVPMGVTSAQVEPHIKLLVLVNDVSLRNLIPAELAKGFGFFQSKPASALSPVAVTPDELGEHWRGGKLHRPLHCDLNGEAFGRADAGRDMVFDYFALISHAAKTRRLGAGTIIGAGTVSNRWHGGPGQPIAAGGVGYCCIAEQRSVETIQHGAPRTPFLRFGDRVRIELFGDDGRSVFGAIDQRVECYAGPGEQR